ncbi:GNAT family N-acetyltransferase [Colwellia sp. 20A7]|uniref:GNAT family N-acetyltransferase n=1 Tax=Colwellia sp. 20A7 TaxID=2689569 RepID=UPI001916C192|nr:GNAT family N-acetyltransferase [Colwellia sp. 20A7]
MKIRRLASSDNNDLFEIYNFPSLLENTSQLPFLNADIVENLFNSPDNYTLVVESQSRVVGHITIFLKNKIREKHGASIAIAVHPDSHGKGIGKMLMLEAINQADNWLNLVRLELEVHVDNLAAISLYEQVGFEIEGTKKLSAFKSGKYLDVHMMSRIRPDYRAKG